MKYFSKKIILIGLVFFTVLIFITPQQLNAQVLSETERLFRDARIQVVNPQTEPRNFTLPLLSGGEATLSSYKGKVVILNFWATWCPPCRTEMPSMETLYKRYKDQGLEMLAVNLREDIIQVRRFIQSGGYTFPIPMDNDGRISNIYGIRAIPTTYIINREGLIIGQVVGSIYWDTPQVFAAFDALLR